MPNLTLFDRLGGETIVTRAVVDFYERVVGDRRLGPFFGQMDMAHQCDQQVRYLVMILGGPNRYTGRSMREAHLEAVDQGLDDSHFDQVVDHLEAALIEVGGSRVDVAEVIKLAATIRAEVLGR